MKCSRAEALMMKYIDGDMSKSEAESLNRHIIQCEACKEAFEIYARMDFTGIVVNPPEIEDNIMNKIYAMPLLTKQSIAPDIGCIILGIVSALTGLSTVLVINKNAVIAALEAVPQFQSYTMYFDKLSYYIQELFDLSVNVVFKGIQGELLQLMGVMLVSIFIITQVISISKEKAN